MRTITKGYRITIDGILMGFRLTKIDAFSGVTLLRLLIRLEGRAEQGDGPARSVKAELQDCPRDSLPLRILQSYLIQQRRTGLTVAAGWDRIPDRNGKARKAGMEYGV